MENPIKTRFPAIFYLIIAVFSTLAISSCSLSNKDQLNLEGKLSDYNHFEIRNGVKVPVGSNLTGTADPSANQFAVSGYGQGNSQAVSGYGQGNYPLNDTINKTKRTFNWNYNGKIFSVDVWLEDSLNYEVLKDYSADDDYYSELLITKPNDNSFKSLTQSLKNLRQMQKLNDDQFLDFLASFIQSIPYDYQAPAKPRSPFQVLKDGTGDCDEKSPSGYKIMKRCGYSVALLYFPPLSGNTVGHMAIGIGCPKNISLNNSGFAYLETTSNRPIGQIPPDRVGQKFKILLPYQGAKIYHSPIKPNA